MMAFCCPGVLLARPAPTFAQVTIPRVTSPPKLENFLTMKPSSQWQGKLAKVDNFTQRTPSDGEPASQRTEAYLGYDDKNLYAIFICFDNDPQKVRARLSRREDVFDDDSVELMLDTFHDHRRAYAFFSNPLGVQADALWTEGQEWDFSFDTVFDSEAKITAEGFVVKLAIPFRSLRFASNDPQTWGILLDRDIRRNNESSFWPRYSSRIEGRLNQAGDAVGLENISPGHNFQLIPYGILRSFPRSGSARSGPSDVQPARCLRTNRSRCQGRHQRQVRAGRNRQSRLQPDRIGRSPGYGKPALRGPVPGEAPLLLENSNDFQTPIPLLFTRRIVDPQWGARLTGRMGPGRWACWWQTTPRRAQRLRRTTRCSGTRRTRPVARVSRDIGDQSSIGLMFTDREEGPYFNRVGGIDGRLKLNSNWVASFQGVLSSTLCSDTRDDVCNFGTYLAGPAAEVIVQRSGRKLNYIVDYADRSDGFRTFTGFDPQPDSHNFIIGWNTVFVPKENI